MEFTYFLKLTSSLFYKITVLPDKDGSADKIYGWQKFDLLHLN